MSGEHSKYTTHVLELVRNNGISLMKKSNDNAFLMFDYFDLLLYRKLKGEEKNYLNYFSIGDTFNDDKDYKVSYKTLSLYCHANKDRQNPFLIKEKERLTEVPFLGLIQISLCSENFTKEKNNHYDIEQFLSNCENSILKMVDEIIEEQKTSLLVKQLYRSSTTGDFCLAVRADTVEKIYSIALALSDSQSNPNRDLKMLTYTNVGIECRMLTDKTYATLNRTFVKEHQSMAFALRFSADLELMTILKKYQETKGDVKLEIFKGLLGRYDYLLHIGMEEFADIYPVLCEKKLGAHEEREEADHGNYETLKDILYYPHIRNINERVLIDLDGFGKNNEEEGMTKDGYLKKVSDKNSTLFKKIKDLEEWESYFAEENRAFRDLARSMQQIYKTYSAIGMEKEAYINWLMFCQDIDILCDCIRRSFEKYVKKCDQYEWSEDERRKYRSLLLKDWRINIQAVNQYTRLVQNINYQTYQSPIYEFQTQIDTEKVIVAYREAMKSFINLYIESNHDGTDDGARLIPIIYPDLSKDKVEVIAPFNGAKIEREQITREIICMVPAFEYFGRLYDLLPWILHESSHHLRILDRVHRNKFLVEYVFSYIFQIVLENALPEFSNDIWHVTLGKAEQKLAYFMLKITVEDFENIEGFKDFGFEEVISEIVQYLEKLFPFGADYVGRKYLYKVQTVRDELFDFYQHEYREEGILEDESLEQIIELKRIQSNQEKLAKGLLKRYSERIFGDMEELIELEDICLKEEQFAKKLLDIREYLLDSKASGDAIKEYSFKVINIYRAFHIYDVIEQTDLRTEKEVAEYLERVWGEYEEWYQKTADEKEKFLMSDPSEMYILRVLGVLNDDKDSFKFKMTEAFQKVDSREIKQYADERIKLYRETFADLLMATSLNITSFGYCRQVLQTISDARIDEKGYQQDDINYRRFQIVTAVLLDEELNGERNSKDEEFVKIDGRSIIEKGIVYCQYTLKCIFQKLMNVKEIKESEDKKRRIKVFLGNMNMQIKCYLEELGEDSLYSSTLLYVLLHGEKAADSEIVEEWHKYDEITEFFKPIKYSFWRLEYFCLGLEYIIEGGYVTVPADIFGHMKSIREKIKKKDGSGCKWENDWECLSQPKMDVSEFYNEPELVYQKETQQKLETTIDFVQNYYYYNRFKVMEEV